MMLRDGLGFMAFTKVLAFFLLFSTARSHLHHHVFNVERTKYTRLCETKPILTVNGEFPGPVLHVERGDTVIVDVYNRADENVTLHWHGVRQLRNPWSDGPAYITQCPITPGDWFRYKIDFTTEEGTLWWHAHTHWVRATVHGAIVIHPNHARPPPFPIPYKEFIVVLGEWWIPDIRTEYERVASGIAEDPSDAYTINGQPGDNYPCSKEEITTFIVERGKTYLFRVINAAMTNGLFMGVAGHRLTLVGSDGSYTKPHTSSYLLLGPGETMDVLLHANRSPGKRYYMAVSPFTYQLQFNGIPATAVVEYSTNEGMVGGEEPPMPVTLPYYNDTGAFVDFLSPLRGLPARQAVPVPERPEEKLYITVALNRYDNRLAASLNNMSFQQPAEDILEAYYEGMKGRRVFEPGFPNYPPLLFDFTADQQPADLLVPEFGTEVKFFEYNEEVEVVFQGTSLVLAEAHPMHLHGHSFYVVGWGFGNFEPDIDPRGFNTRDPIHKNTVWLPRDGWVAIRFFADNPGTWFLHCHFESHMTWGMTTVFIVRDGDKPWETLLPPPPYMPPC